MDENTLEAIVAVAFIALLGWVFWVSMRSKK